MKRYIYLHLSLLDHNYDFELRKIAALPDLRGVVEGVLVSTLSMYEQPNAPSHPLVRMLVETCQACTFRLCWGRNLWINWPGLNSARKQSKSDVVDAAYYAACLSNLQREAKALGAMGTLIYTEPHAESPYCLPQSTWFKEEGFDGVQMRSVKVAIALARRAADHGADYVYPVGVPQSKAARSDYGLAMRGLGRLKLHHTTYGRTKPPNTDLEHCVQLDAWGTWLTLEPTDHTLTIAQWQALDWEAIQAQYPECRMNWLYAEGEGFIDIARELERLHGEGKL